MMLRKIKTRFLILLVSLFLIPFHSLQAWGAGLEIEFEKVAGSSGTDRGTAALQTVDGGYVVVGETMSSYLHGHSKYDAYLLKLDAKGLLKWQKTYGGGSDDRALSIKQTKDDGFILTGVTQSFNQSLDKNVYLVKTDASGQKKWYRTYGGSGDDSGTWVEQTSDGGYIIVGETTSSGAGDKDIYLIKTNDQGQLMWEQTLGGKGSDSGVSVLATKDGGYLLVGQTNSTGAGSFDIYLAKVDGKGKKEWAKTLGGSGLDCVNSLKETTDGGYIIAGESSTYNPTGSDAYLLKIDNAGNLQWEKTYGGNGWAVGKSVQQVPEGGYLLAGWTTAKDRRGFDLYLVKTDEAGKKLWDKTLARDKFDPSFSIQQTNNGIIITGWCIEKMKWTQNRNDDVEVYFMKLKLQ
ncbi:conserved hypothetical protein [Desulforamulus reducens MI-1]|uniref:Uncharacterized protein n=1 Tax=Desulforamulus reducens (strain ATCC BAA-1160 / DSM 100696 / MI-1) TaxID=349161 RepID=A4J3C8_DESRM|nr:PQQ-binding-like beta-propeller repeat protein [Desulforamulus reducens]ABO49581.1 conserved hypothetical protein [Desulforamulus reducens MI-1]